jgi:hypothetical protein
MSALALVPTQSQIQAALRGFLLAVLPPGIEIVEGQDNRVPEPVGPDFVVFTAMSRERISTNVDSWIDCAFAASSVGTTLTVSAMLIGSIAPAATLFGVDVAAGTTITSQISGTPGGVGAYLLSISQNLSSAKMACGIGHYLQPTRVDFQLDVHGPNSADNAQTISTMFRDDYAFQQFKTQAYDIAPLYADDPKQVPFIDAEQQYETRWIVEACVQANQIVTAAQDFADQLQATLINVYAAYHP